ncbi:thiol-disulfide oxidoreductase ResA [Legionella waltersii]|uniref:Thiol-disulfide oxidoreductase ResA n=1 Tax=Legionella waltersii TaxID=66969 RepID=A0A0W1A5A4_9GAMM|nr:thiol-disulfide oxidoreductase ResA [Legionella waltersii]SNU93762.1 thiol-disulfide oxidoreductase [Legionella waltersii]
MKTVKQLILCTMLLLITTLCQADVLLKDIEGQVTPFSTLKGKWVLINYWASWCETCVQEIPELNRFYHAHKKDPVALFAVNYDALSSVEQRALAEQLNIAYPNLLENPAKALNLGDITGVPVTFIFNPDGQLVKKLYGGQTVKSLDKIVSRK